MSAIIVNYSIDFKDAADPSTSSVANNLNGDRYSVVMPTPRAFMGAIVINTASGTAAGKFFIQASNDFVMSDDAADINRVNSENLVTNWATIEERSVGSADVDNLFQLGDIGYRWVRVFYDSTSGTANITSARANFKGY
jgi:hypothetical protein